MEQGRAEPPHPASRALDARPRRGRSPGSAVRAALSDTGQCVSCRQRLPLRCDVRPGYGLGQERPGRRRLRAADPRPGHSAGLAAPVPRRQPLRHRSPERQVLRILGVADFLSLTPASASTRPAASPPQDRAKTSNERIAVTVAIGLAAQPRCVQMLHLRLDRAAVRWGCGLLSPLVRITRGSGCHGEPRQSAEAAERHAIGKSGYNCGG